MLDLQQPNILMRFLIESTNEHFLIYSNTDGLNHMDKLLANNPLFYNLLSPTEVFQKLSDHISYNLFSNSINGLTTFSKWHGNFLRIYKDDESKFYQKFQPWLFQLEGFVGKKNLFQLHVLEKDFYDFFDTIPKEIPLVEQNNYFIQFLENHRLHNELNSTLLSNNNSIKKNKI